MANESLIVGNSNWAVKANNLLGYAVGETSGYYVPRELNFTRNSTATYTDENGIIQTAAANIARVQDNALLLEPQRTNLLLRSEEFDNAYWRKLNGTITANATTSPDGTQNADKCVVDNGFSIMDMRTASSLSITSGSVYTWSLYVKNAGYRYCQMTAWTGDDPVTVYDLDNGVVVSESGPPHTSTIKSVGDGWYRITITRTSVSGNAWMRFSPLASTITTVQNGTDGTYIWGAQLEQGAYATSYIPTTSATVTRLADACSKTGISSLIGQTEGVLYWEGVVLNQTDIVAINRSTVNGIYITKGSGNLYRAAIYNSSSVIQFADVGVKTTTTKIAIAYKSGDSALFVNGSKIGATNTSTITFSGALSELRLNDNYLIATAPQFTNKINIYNTRLTDSDCISLTTL